MAWKTTTARRWYYRARRAEENASKRAWLKRWTAYDLADLHRIAAEYAARGEKLPAIWHERFRVETRKAERAAARAQAERTDQRPVIREAREAGRAAA